MAHLKLRGKTWYLVRVMDGTKQARSLQTTSKSEANAKLRAFHNGQLPELFAELDARADGTDTRKFWARYDQWQADEFSPNTLRIRRSHWKRFLAELNPPTLESVTPADVTRVRAKLRDEGKSGAFINGWVRSMRAIYNHAAAGVIPSFRFEGANPFVGFRKVEEAVRETTLTAGQSAWLMLQAQRYAIENDYEDLRLIVGLALYAALRKAECLAARWEWIRPDGAGFALHVQSGHGWKTKTRRPREVAMRRELLELLRPHWKSKGYIVAPGKSYDPQGRYRVYFQKHWEALRAAAGFPNLRFHDLRHTRTTLWLSAGVSPAKVEAWGGWSSGEMRRRYGHIQGFDPDVDRG